MSPVRPLHARDGAVLARVLRGVTLYADASAALDAGAAAWRAWRACAGPAALGWFTTSAMVDWEPVSEAFAGRIEEALTPRWDASRPRHAFELRVVDVVDDPAWEFAWRERDPSRASVASSLQCSLPLDAPAEALLHLAIELGHALPVLAGVGGFAARWNPSRRGAAMRALRPWARRYVGLDLPDPDGDAWAAPGALPAVGWLTLLGPALAAAAAPALRAPWQEDVRVMSLTRAALVRAGAEPALGDVNALRFPHAYAEVASRLDPLLARPASGRPHWGEDADETRRWARRFAEPEAWLGPLEARAS